MQMQETVGKMTVGKMDIDDGGEADLSSTPRQPSDSPAQTQVRLSVSCSRGAVIFLSCCDAGCSWALCAWKILTRPS